MGGSGGKGPRCGEGRVALDLEKPGAARIYSYPAAGPRDGHPFRTLFSMAMTVSRYLWILH